MSFLQIDFFSENRGMLPHDRDITYHNHDGSSTSRALLGLTVLDNLVCSRSHITTVTSCHHDRDLLTIIHHDRDCLQGRFWGAHDRCSRSWWLPSSSWPSKFLIFKLVYFWFLLNVLRRYNLAFRGVTIFGIRAGIRSKIGFWRLKNVLNVVYLIDIRFFV